MSREAIGTEPVRWERSDQRAEGPRRLDVTGEAESRSDGPTGE